ncbi:flippase [Geodermatophilus sp. SYSU D00965]
MSGETPRAERRGSSALLLLESILRMGSGFVVAVLVARTYGPEGLGLVTTAVAAVTIVMGFSALGLSGVLVRELVDSGVEGLRLVSTVATAKLIAGTVLLAGLMTSLTILSTHPGVVSLAMVIATGFLFSALDPVDALYQARNEFHRLVVLRLVGLCLSAGLKISVAVSGAPLIWVAIGYALDYCLLYLLPVVDFAVRQAEGWRGTDEVIRVDMGLLHGLLRKSWPILVSGGLAQLNLKADALLIAGLASVSSVGAYSAATRLSEAWSVLAMAIVTARFPTLVRMSKGDAVAYGAALSGLLRRLIWTAVCGAVLISMVAPYVVGLVYGSGFDRAADVLRWHVFGGVFLFVRTAVSRWLIVEGLYKLSLVSHGAGALMNIALNLALVPAIGIIGAAWASVLSYAVSGVGFLVLTKRSRPMFQMILISCVPKQLSGGLAGRLAHEMATSRRQVDA